MGAELDIEKGTTWGRRADMKEERIEESGLHETEENS